MQDDPMEVHLEAALRIAVGREEGRIDALLRPLDEPLKGEAEAMRPIFAVLEQLAEVCAQTPGLTFDPPPSQGHIATIRAQGRLSVI
jgi:hypothetical protein